MKRLIPAAILLLSLTPFAAQSESGITIGPLAQGFFPERDDDLPELFLPADGDSEPSNFEPADIDPSVFEPAEGDSDPSNFEPEEGDSDVDSFERIGQDELPQTERLLA